MHLHQSVCDCLFSCLRSDQLRRSSQLNKQPILGSPCSYIPAPLQHAGNWPCLVQDFFASTCQVLGRHKQGDEVLKTRDRPSPAAFIICTTDIRPLFIFQVNPVIRVVPKCATHACPQVQRGEDVSHDCCSGTDVPSSFLQLCVSILDPSRFLRVGLVELAPPEIR